MNPPPHPRDPFLIASPPASPPYFKTTTTATSPSTDALTAAELREASGMCPSCGQQLYRWQKQFDGAALCDGIASSSSCFPGINCSSSNGKSSQQLHQQRKIPLSIPRLVERGQCLVCQKKPTSSLQDTEALFSSYSKHLSTPAAAAGSHPSSAIYRGPYNERGQRHGQGEMVWNNGDVYRGNFVNNHRHGHGELTFGHNGVHGEYVGEWQHDQMHGHGTRRYANGDCYVGAYENSIRNGEGRFYYANGDLYWGQWRHNQMHGPGRYYYASGQRFEGTFVHSKRTGKGKLQRTDGTLEIFQYLNDQRVGQGVRWSTDRTKAWRLWIPSSEVGKVGQGGAGGTALQKQKISVAEAVSLAYDIDQAAAQTLEEYNLT